MHAEVEHTNWIPPKSEKKHWKILETYSNEDYDGDFAYAAVKIHRERAKEILHMFTVFDAAKKAAENLLEMYFWDVDIRWFSLGDDGPADCKGCDEHDLRADCAQIVITDDSVRWMSYPKHGDAEIRTDSIARKEIEKRAR